MKFLLLNAQSFNTAKEDIQDLVDNYDIDFLCLNETWENKDKPIKFRNWKSFNRPRPGSSHGGVAIFINQSKVSYIVEQNLDFEDKNLECVAVRIRTNLNVELNLLVPYIPPGKDEQLKLFSDKLSSSRLKNVVVMGDLNAKRVEWNNTQGNSGGIIVEEMLTNCNLVCLNDGQPTRRNSTSVIDLVLCSTGIVQYSRECSTLSHEKVRSDHIAVFLEADFDLAESGQSISVVRPIKKADWGKWTETTEEKFEDFGVNSSGNLEEDYAKFRELMQEAMDTVIPQKTVKIKKSAARPYWWNEDVKEAKTELNLCQKNYKKRNTVQNKEKLLEAESHLEEVKVKAQDEWTDRLLTSFENATSSKERWDMYRKLTEKKEETTVLPLIWRRRKTSVYKRREM